jgi:hypothetical protein
VTGAGKPTVSWGHEQDIDDAFGLVNLSFQAIGTNAGGGWHMQGDWIDSVTLAMRYEAAYLEIYYADFMPLDEEHHIVTAFNHDGGETEGAPGFVGFRPWLESRNRRLHKCRRRFNRLIDSRRLASGGQHHQRHRLTSPSMADWKTRARRKCVSFAIETASIMTTPGADKQ